VHENGCAEDERYPEHEREYCLCYHVFTFVAPLAAFVVAVFRRRRRTPRSPR
jgi:hypothetical protein